MNSLALLPSSSNQIIIVSNHVTDIVDQDQILYLKATGNYTEVYLFDNSYVLISKTLKTIEKMLNQKLFYRCHKSFTVNLNYIKQIRYRDTIYLIIKGNVKIPISKRKLAPLKQRINQKFEPVYSLDTPVHSIVYPVHSLEATV